jgi:phosphate transport system substrate-binding protein
MLPALAAVVLSLLAAGCSTTVSPVAAPPASPARAPAVTPDPAPVALSETGSTLLFPLLTAWASAYHQQFSQVTISTAGTGSGAGIKAASAGTADIGASDAYLSSGNLGTHPGVSLPGYLSKALAAGYPIVNYEHAIVSTWQPTAAKARDLQAFLHWAITTGNSAQFLGQVRFQPLPR